MKKRIRKKEKQLALRDQVKLYKKKNNELIVDLVQFYDHIEDYRKKVQQVENSLIEANCALQNEIIDKNKQIAQLKEDNKKLQTRLQAKHKSAPVPTSSIQRITSKIKEFVSGKN